MDEDSYASSSSCVGSYSSCTSSPASIASTRATSIWDSAIKSGRDRGAGRDRDDSGELDREASPDEKRRAKRRKLEAPVFCAAWDGVSAVRPRHTTRTGDDRFIPKRGAPLDTFHRFELAERAPLVSPGRPRPNNSRDTLYRSVIQHELFGTPLPKASERVPLRLSANRASFSTPARESILSFKVDNSPNKISEENLPIFSFPSFLSSNASSALRDYSAVARRPRTRPTHSFRVLDAPDMVYPLRSVLAWSSKNALAAALQRTAIYLLPDADVSTTPPRPAVHLTRRLSVGEISSLSWNSAGDHLIAANLTGAIHVLDANTQTIVRTLKTHRSAVYRLAFSEPLFVSAGVSGEIHVHDLRAASLLIPVQVFKGHKTRVSSLGWSPTDSTALASGGVDQNLLVWDSRTAAKPIRRMRKAGLQTALAWSPHKRGVLATSGGESELCDWNTLEIDGTERRVETGAAIGSIIWSKTSQELATSCLSRWTIGGRRAAAPTARPSHPIQIWRYVNLTRTASLLGHAAPVGELSLGPNSSSIASGSVDETIRIWNTFPAAESKSRSRSQGELGERRRAGQLR